ncbi:hypothetical protein SCHPADRAFT_944438 [Schizopora paradoxa]|uniref:F-box domain-containing protein n=1 Tax=Schizopora paradoxa TaxID=27342 RepID=A0A0H2R9F7_9AGAM|nr:hypothetical protein SCHPADRAFT_944438 [Schizopora paradoxa]
MQAPPHTNDASLSPGSTSKSSLAMENETTGIDCEVYPLINVVQLLGNECRRIEDYGFATPQGGDRILDWRFSAFFRDGLWGEFKEDFNFLPKGIRGIRNGGLDRINEVRDATQQLRSTIWLLDLLKSSAHDLLQSVEIELKNSHHNFGRLLNRLPLDLLSEVVRFACSDAYELVEMSHVNRRFRDVVLSMADMWASITSDLPTELLRLSIQRSKNASLDISGDFLENRNGLMHQHPQHPTIKSWIKSFISEIAQCSSRWKTVEFSMPQSRHRVLKVESYMLYLMLSTPFFCDLSLPRLTTLSITHNGYIPDNRKDEDNTRAKVIEALHFYRSWIAPKLRLLNFSRIIPAPVSGASIEVLSLDLRSSATDPNMEYLVAFQDLVVFLQETPSLQTLKLYCVTWGMSDFGVEHHVLPMVVLQNLRDLTMVLEHGRPSSPTRTFSLTSFTDRLCLPNISTLHVKLSTRSPDSTANHDVTDLFNRLIPQHGLTSLEKLFLFILDHRPSSTPSLSVALDQYPSLRSLTLGITGKLVVRPGSTIHPDVIRRGTLEEVKLLACTDGVDSFLSWMAGELGDSNKVKRVKLVVKKCKIEKSEIEKVFPSDKLEYEPIRGWRTVGYWESRTGHEYFSEDIED